MLPVVQSHWFWTVLPRCIGDTSGGNDLAKHHGKALILDVLRDLTWLKATYPAVSIVWSTFTPQMAWRDARNFLSINTARRSVNREVCKVVCAGLGSVVGHQRIHLDRPELFQSDGVHLFNGGLDVFLEDIKGGLHSELDRLDGRHGT